MSVCVCVVGFFFFFFFFGEAIGTAATPGLLCQPRVIVKIFDSRYIFLIFLFQTVFH
jgi:hypothetical protein